MIRCQSANLPFYRRRCIVGVVHQIAQQRRQTKSAVEVKGKHVVVFAGENCIFEGIVDTADFWLEISCQGDDSSELRHVLGQAHVYLEVPLWVRRVHQSGKTSLTFAAYIAAKYQGHTHSIRGERPDKACSSFHLDPCRMRGAADGCLCHGVHLAKQTATGDTLMLVARPGNIALELSAKRLPAGAHGNGLRQLLADESGCSAGSAQMPLTWQGRQPGLNLADQVDRQGLDRKHKLSAARRRAGRQ